MDSNVRMLPLHVARDLETLLGLTEERCRRCASFRQSTRRDVDRGHCTIKRVTVDAGDHCDRFLLKYHLR